MKNNLILLVVFMAWICIGCSSDQNETVNVNKEEVKEEIQEVDPIKEAALKEAQESYDKAIEYIENQLINPHSMELLEDIKIYIGEAENGGRAAWLNIEFSADNAAGGTLEAVADVVVYLESGYCMSYMDYYGKDDDAVDLVGKQNILLEKANIMTNHDEQNYCFTVNKDNLAISIYL